MQHMNLDHVVPVLIAHDSLKRDRRSRALRREEFSDERNHFGRRGGTEHLQENSEAEIMFCE